MTKYIFVTGGVVSSLGKGIASASLGAILEARGLKVTLNVEELLKHKHEYEGKEYVTIEVAKMQKPDRFDRTHTAYVSVLKGTEE